MFLTIDSDSKLEKNISKITNKEQNAIYFKLLLVKAQKSIELPNT